MEPDQHISEIVLKTQVANIIKKSRSGKVITAREAEIIKDFEDLKNVAKDKPTKISGKINIAVALGITRPTLDAWMKYPDFPKPSITGFYILEEITEWIKTKGFKGGESTETEKLRLRRLLAQCKKIEVDNSIKLNEYEKKSVIDFEVTRMVNAFKIVILELPRKCAMTCAGRAAPDIEKIVRDMVDECLLQLHRDAWRS